MAAQLVSWCSSCCRRKTQRRVPGGAALTSTLIAAIRSAPDDADAVDRSCVALLEVLSANRGNQVIAVANGILPLIAAALRNPALERRVPPLAPRLCEVLTCLVDEHPDHQAAAARAGVLGALLSAAATAAEAQIAPGAASSVSAAVCRALWVTVFDCPPNQAAAVREGGLPVLVALLAPPPSAGAPEAPPLQTAAVIEAASRALRTLTVFSPEHAAAARSAGAVVALEAARAGLLARGGGGGGGEEAAVTAVERALAVLVPRGE